MNKMKKLIDSITNVEKTVDVIEERTKKLDKLDKIEEVVNQLRIEVSKNKQ
jgi:hypothetical protein